MIELPKPEIAFDAEKHIYTLDGLKVPSVTQIMAPMSMMLYDGIPYETLSQAADRGTRAHEQISNYITYGVLEDDEDTKGYLSAFRTFQRHFLPTWLASEYRTYHRQLRYAGTLDLIGYIRPNDGKGVDVVDIKCTAQYHPVLLETQLGGYCEALKSHDVPVRKRYGLQLMRSGQYRFEEVKDGYKLFLHCLAITNAMMRERRA